MSTWELPGYEVEEMLGFGATGEVWQARERATGQTVALKRLRAGAPPGAAEALRSEASLLRAVDTPYLVHLRAVVDDVLVLDHAAGGSLAALLSRRGVLEPGEVVTVASPLASALAAVHAAGLVHGDVSPANVLFTAEGMPLLADLGVGRHVRTQAPDGEVRATAEYVDPVVVRGAAPGPAADVWALGAVCHHLLAGSPPHEGASTGHVLAAAAAGSRAPLGLLAPTAPRALVAVVEQALAADPAARPSAAALAQALHRAQAPAAVRLTGGRAGGGSAQLPETATVPRPPRPPEPASGRRRVPVAALAGATLVLLLLSGGLLWAVRGAGGGVAQALPPAVPSTGVPSAAPPRPTPAAPSAAAPPAAAPSAAAPSAAAPPDWGQVLSGLDAVRGRAYAAGEPELLAEVYAAGSAPGAADRAALAALVDQGRTAQGVLHVVHRVEQRSATADRARLHVVDVLGEQTVRDAADAVVQTRPGRGERAYDVELVRQEGEWRIADLQPA